MKQRVKSGFLLILDVLLINISLISAYYLKFEGQFEASGFKGFQNYIIQVAIIATVVKIISYFFFKLYSSLWKYASIYELISIGLATGFSNLVMFAYVIVDFEFTNVLLAPRSIFLIAFLIDAFLISVSRFGYRITRRFIRGDSLQFKKKKRVLVYGAGEAGAIIIKEMKSHHEMKSTPDCYC
jgi:FlaA1/EpsC-like NDP-sugar epimerase